ncbi:DNA topoisomerase I [Tistlia consotensis]|uniref:DNA topoisomerase 1 n=1 Tax=Tistlia consotensis USBA 355 TaxID=560819 RepID=A0A1Y6BNX4_9PROT|nr:type I DNA topoisomerase [Tistlia consotensis]SMF20743.1 DNA topoisomerase I [Tistlia consotensis USBA 355]SNR47612.1 DNA topoisomerase I [Tistlia consotensis]
MHVVVVESPAKAKTINKYLGKDFQVLASYGHVRDLPSKDGSVLPDQDFAMAWEVEGRGERQIKEIAQAVRNADRLYLATDPDREGEAISWHIVEELKRRRILKDIPVQRVVFNEITRNAVIEAFKQPRDIDVNLVDAYLARRALDYLVGFTLSPVLWRKLPGSRSAGRVQSVALRLICEREAEIEVFRAQEYWSVEALLDSVATAPFKARLTHLEGRKLERLEIGDKGAADRAVAAIRGAGRYTVASVEKKQVRRNPQPPFTTSTLQQEASRKLGFGASRTMRIAQKLYEGVEVDGETVGLITYMRTDGVAMSNEAIGAARQTIAARYGDNYLPNAPRQYKTKAKNAQEAHEAIRPTDFGRHPDQVRRRLSEEEARLYDLVYVRALASQMEAAQLEQVAVDIRCGGASEASANAAGAGVATLRATGQVVLFDGFLRLYQEGRDDDEEESSQRLPKLAEGQDLTLRDVLAEQHFTQPPPRYSEASLVKKLEELGIGRPSTYASILQVLQDREYVRLDKRRFLPEDRGRLVTAFLSAFFQRYVEYSFTASMEEELDEVSDGKVDYKTVLRRFWEAFAAAVEETKGLRIADVIDALDRDLGPHFFPIDPDKPGVDPRACPVCGNGRLGIRLGKTGGFVGCSNYPECRYTRPLIAPGSEEAEQAAALGGDTLELGTDPGSGQSVTLRKGPYGFYIQLGEAKEKGDKPKRSSLPPNTTPDSLDLDLALKLLALPRSLGVHEGEEVTAGIGRYGPYVKRASVYKSIPKDEDVLTIGMNRAIDLLSQKPGGEAKTIGNHPDDGKPVTAQKGRYGPYVKHGKINATLPKDLTLEEITLDKAVELLRAQAEKKGAGKGKAPAKAAPKAKTAPKAKAPAKKAATKSAGKTGARSKAKAGAKTAKAAE